MRLLCDSHRCNACQSKPAFGCDTYLGGLPSADVCNAVAVPVGVQEVGEAMLAVDPSLEGEDEELVRDAVVHLDLVQVPGAPEVLAVAGDPKAFDVADVWRRDVESVDLQTRGDERSWESYKRHGVEDGLKVMIKGLFSPSLRKKVQLTRSRSKLFEEESSFLSPVSPVLP